MWYVILFSFVICIALTSSSSSGAPFPKQCSIIDVQSCEQLWNRYNWQIHARSNQQDRGNVCHLRQCPSARSADTQFPGGSLHPEYKLNNRESGVPVLTQHWIHSLWFVNNTSCFLLLPSIPPTPPLSQSGFAYSLAQQTVSVNYLGTEFQLQPSDLKLTVSIDDWQWAQAYLGPQSSLKLVLRNTIHDLC